MRRSLSLFIFALIALLGTGTVAVEVASASSVVLPTVSGGYGSTPKISFPSQSPPTGLQSKVLSTGKGATVAKGNLLVANYVGQIWKGKVFDSSFSRNQVAAFPIGVGAVIKGWDEGLVGKKLGSRVLLVIPPSLGYGSSGSTQAGIKGTDTIIFVIDLVAAYSKNAGQSQSATVVTSSTHGVSISNLLSTSPTITVAKATSKPTAESTALLARGNGAKVKAGMLILQYAAVDWTSKLVVSTWKSGTPDGEYVGSSASPSVFDPLVGDSIGSRVLVELPANQGQGPYALEVQITGEVPPGASKS